MRLGDSPGCQKLPSQLVCPGELFCYPYRKRTYGLWQERTETMKTRQTIRLHSQDNVVVCCGAVSAGAWIEEEGLTALEDIPRGYKMSTREIRKGEAVRKYNAVIGYAKYDIEPGRMLHVQNIDFIDVPVDYGFCREYTPTVPQTPETFQGYVRSDGRVGTRNYIGVFAMSNCAATVVRRIAAWFTAERLAMYPQIDGVVPFVIATGCGMESSGEPMDCLRRTISGYLNHPNIAGAVVVSLGCERNDAGEFFRVMGKPEGKVCVSLVMQEEGGTRATIARGIEAVERMLPAANSVRRQAVSVEHLTVALECGGSDSFSGLSANPALGVAVTKLVRQGGTAILSEISEIFGAEFLLTRRAATPQVARKLLDRITWWREYSRGCDTQINGHVTPGNVAGGITNVLEKSLGGIKKGGETGLMEVYRYAEPVREKGLVFMDTPGYDPVAVTGQVAGGANLVAFTTGRGSCFGSVPAPTLKLATNTPMYEKMRDDMDLNCGLILDGKQSVQEMGEEIFRQLVEIASGKKTRSEQLGLGEDEFQPWNPGVLS